MHEHVSKRVKMQRKPTGGTNNHGKHIIARNKKREGYARSDPVSEQGLMGVRYNHIRSSPRRAPNMAKPRTREAKTSIKHRSRQA